jgi:hypothetical protein
MTVRVGELETTVDTQSRPVEPERPRREATKDQRLRQHRAMAERLKRDALRTAAEGYDG